MNSTGDALDLCDWQRNGSYPIDAGDIAELAEATTASGLLLLRIDVGTCANKKDLLQHLSKNLSFPSGFGHNWDALSDNLRDLDWLPAAGYMLVFEHADKLEDAAEDEFAIFVDILDDAAAAWQEREVPFFAFLVTGGSDGNATGSPRDEIAPARTPGTDRSESRRTVRFELHGDYVELNQLLKLAGLCDSGGAGKALVAQGIVRVDGVRELRKTCKIRDGQIVDVGDDMRIEVSRDTAAPWSPADTATDKASNGSTTRMHGEYKVPGGKLVVADLAVIDGRLADVQISGDFFLEPDSALAMIDSALCGLPRDVSKDGIGDALRAAISPEVAMYGLSIEAIAIAVGRALGNEEQA